MGDIINKSMDINSSSQNMLVMNVYQNYWKRRGFNMNKKVAILYFFIAILKVAYTESDSYMYLNNICIDTDGVNININNLSGTYWVQERIYVRPEYKSGELIALFFPSYIFLDSSRVLITTSSVYGHRYKKNEKIAFIAQGCDITWVDSIVEYTTNFNNIIKVQGLEMKLDSNRLYVKDKNGETIYILYHTFPVFTDTNFSESLWLQFIR